MKTRTGSTPALLPFVLVLLGICLTAAPTANAADPGSTQKLVYGSGAESHPYIVYTPTSYDPRHPAPLVVATHGCMTTADQFLAATQYNRLAEREGFVVAYVDVDPATAALPQPLRSCWHFYDASTWHRDQGDAAAVAGMTRAVMGLRKIDPQRVYMAGTSAGGFMTASMAAAYPDIFAAVAIVAGGAYDDGFCFFGGKGLATVEQSAERARAEMGPRARIVPRMVMGGDADLAISPECADKAFFQGLRTNNLVIGDSQTSPISLAPSSTRIDPNPGGYGSTIGVYRDPAGCLIGERWLIHGMGHFWPGGPSDPEWANWTDPKGPSGAEATWAFFKRFTKHSTAMPCAEAPVKKPVARCKKRKISLRVFRRSRKVKVWVNGRRVRSRARGRWVRAWLPATRRSRTVAVVRGRKANGKKFTRRHHFKGCGPRAAHRR